LSFYRRDIIMVPVICIALLLLMWIVRSKSPAIGDSTAFWGVGAVVGLVLLTSLIERLPLVKERNRSFDQKINQLALAATAKDRAKAEAYRQSHYAWQSQIVKPVYDEFGMTDVWALMDSGKCDEAEKLLQNPASYEKMDKRIGAAQREATIAQDLKRCRNRFMSRPNL
jgi:hypothetical protein